MGGDFEDGADRQDGEDTANEDTPARSGMEFSLKPPPAAVPLSAPARPESAQSYGRPGSIGGGAQGAEKDKGPAGQTPQPVKHKSGLSQLRGLASGRKKEKEKK